MPVRRRQRALALGAATAALLLVPVAGCGDHGRGASEGTAPPATDCEWVRAEHDGLMLSACDIGDGVLLVVTNVSAGDLVVFEADEPPVPLWVDGGVVWEKRSVTGGRPQPLQGVPHRGAFHGGLAVPNDPSQEWLSFPLCVPGEAALEPTATPCSCFR